MPSKKLEINGFIEKKEDESNKKIKKLFPTEKGKNVYPFIKRENDYSNTVALEGFSETEAETISNLLQRVRKKYRKRLGICKKREIREIIDYIKELTIQMTTHIEKCTLKDIHKLQEISYETFNETFKHQNSPENMHHYLEKGI